MPVAFDANVPIDFNDTDMQSNQYILHVEETPTSSNFEGGLLVPDCMHFPDQCWHDHSPPVHANDDGDADMEFLLDMWESWVSQLQPLNINGASDASALAAMADPPPHQLNVVARGSPSLPNLEAGPAQPLLNLEPSGAISNCSSRESSEEAVKLLVETSTPAIDDGYVWLKYGQKRIKARMHPRGYFKCAQPNCPVKKHTESSSDKQGIILITYFGRHNHDPPQSSS